MKKRILQKATRPQEEKIEDIKFNVYKFNNRPKPHKGRVLIQSCFSEFGCEMVGCMYCLPRVLQMYPGLYTIAVGWHGREYLYRHLVDEFWEIKEEHMWLRDYARAFHHRSSNLSRIEKVLKQFGNVLPSSFMGNVAVGNICRTCGHFWGDIKRIEECCKCNSTDVVRSIFGDTDFYKKHAVRIPVPSEDKIAKAKEYLGPNPVGIFARNRSTYGRNLDIEFYSLLIKRLEKMGHTPIWLGEKQSTYPCPEKHIIDMSRREEAKDLELTLAIISKLEFTVQFWTASTRLAAVMGVPYLLFESPEQVWGDTGQEGYRINLSTFGSRKICISHFLNVQENHAAGIDLVQRCIREMKEDNYKDVVGMVDNSKMVKIMQKKSGTRTGSVL